jgi:hypothetical protein
MLLSKFKARLRKIQSRGYISTKRKGNTGIGYTFESLLGLKENNIRIPDLGNIELKTKRRNTSSKVTMFTFNRGAWIVPLSEVIKKYGYVDKYERHALKCTVSIKPNPQGLYLRTTRKDLQLHNLKKDIIASWKSDILMDYFSRKLPSLIIVTADTRRNSRGREEFHYSEAYLLNYPSKQGLLKLIDKGYIVVDLRMHLTKSRQVRNRGTAFRIAEENLLRCFKKVTKLL